jgi:sortase A
MLKKTLLFKFKIFILLILGCLAFIAFQANIFKANAQPILDVSVKAINHPLLGGPASYQITITNTGNKRGYNLTVKNLFSSSKDNPLGKIKLIGVESSKGPLSADEVFSDQSSGNTTINFINIKDLEPDEVYSIILEVDTSVDETWQVYDEIILQTTAFLNPIPDGSGTDIIGEAATQNKISPILFRSKSADQSSGVEQVPGTLNKAYAYTLTIENNHLFKSNNITLTDKLPDGIEFLEMKSNHQLDAGYPKRDAKTGETLLKWTIESLKPSQVEKISYKAGIRYDYFGSNNGGTNREHDTFSDSANLGKPIENKTVFTNQALLITDYFDNNRCKKGCSIAQEKEHDITASYSTIQKSADKTVVGIGDKVKYTIDYYASEYYDLLDSPDNPLKIIDTLSDGQTYNNNASPKPSSVVKNDDGTTTLIWDNQVLKDLKAGQQRKIKFSVTINKTWDNPDYPYNQGKIVGADELKNEVELNGTWEDIIDQNREKGSNKSNSSVDLKTLTMKIKKEVQDSRNSNKWQEETTATVGDTLNFRLRINTNNGKKPISDNIAMKDVMITDWLPKGVSYNDDFQVKFSDKNDFTDPYSDKPNLNFKDKPEITSLGGLTGLKWYLGNISEKGWWEVTFSGTVIDDDSIFNGKRITNRMKMGGENTLSNRYSERSHVFIDLILPELVLEKTATKVPDPLVPDSKVTYTVQITNIGGIEAKNLIVKDTLPLGMRQKPPKVTEIRINNKKLKENKDYKIDPTFNPETGEWFIDFTQTKNSKKLINLEPNEVLTIKYEAFLDPMLGSGIKLKNISTVSYSSSDDEKGRIIEHSNDTQKSNTDDATIQIAKSDIKKSADKETITVGDKITYTLTITVPEKTYVFWPTIKDRIKVDGCDYVQGSSQLIHVSGQPKQKAILREATNPDPVIKTDLDNRTDLTWYLENYIDNSNQDKDYVFKIKYDVIYQGLNDDQTFEFFLPTSKDIIKNTAVFEWSFFNTDKRSKDISDYRTERVNLDQPLLKTEKKIISEKPYLPGSEIFYEVIIKNIGERPAYDIFFEDQISNFSNSPKLETVTHSQQGVLEENKDYLKKFQTLPVTLNFNGQENKTVLNPNETLTLTYSVILNNPLGSGADIINVCDVDWSSQPDQNLKERIYNDSDNEAIYTDDTTDQKISIPLAEIEKTSDLEDQAAIIGQTFNYLITVDIPPHTTLFNASIKDLVPDGLTVLNVRQEPKIGQINYEENSNGQTEIIWQLGDVGDHEFDKLKLILEVKVDNEFVDGLPLDGLPQEVDGDGFDQLLNQAEIKWDNAKENGKTFNDFSQYSIDIVEPNLEIIKIIDSDKAKADQTVVYTVELKNTGSSNAYNIILEDQMPEELFETAKSPRLLAINHSQNGQLIENNDFLINLENNPIIIDFNGQINKTSLAPGEKITIQYEADIEKTANDGEILYNKAQVTQYTTGPDLDSKVKKTDPVIIPLNIFGPNLYIEIDDKGISSKPEELVTYLINYANNGGGSDENVEIIIEIPKNSTFIAEENDPNWNCEPNLYAGSICSYIIGDLDGGGDGGSLEFTVQINDNLTIEVNQLEIIANITDSEDSLQDPDLSDNSDDDFTPIKDAYPDLKIVKDSNREQALTGQNLTYLINYSNSGTLEAKNVVIIEKIPQNTIFDPELNDDGWKCFPGYDEGSLCNYSIGSLKAKTEGSLSFTVTVKEQIVSIDSISNTITILDDSINQLDDNPDDNQYHHTIPIIIDNDQKHVIDDIHNTIIKEIEIDNSDEENEEEEEEEEEDENDNQEKNDYYLSNQLAQTGSNLILPISLGLILTLTSLASLFLFYKKRLIIKFKNKKYKFYPQKKLNKLKNKIAFLSFLSFFIGLGFYFVFYPLIPQISYHPSAKKIELPQQAETQKENLLVIPKINLKEKIIEGKTNKALNKGIWRRPNSSNPKQGGNTVLTGHNFEYFKSQHKNFYFLNKLEINDPIKIYWDNQEFTYQVTEIFTVTPNQLEIEENTKEDILTLYTCTPLLTAKDRLVVRARRI